MGFYVTVSVFHKWFFLLLHKAILQIIHLCDICPIILAFNHITRNSCKFRKKSFVEGERRQGGKCESVGHKNCQEACGECRIIVKKIIKIATYHQENQDIIKIRSKCRWIWSRRAANVSAGPSLPATPTSKRREWSSPSSFHQSSL